jgi:hypothetical protein
LARSRQLRHNGARVAPTGVTTLAVWMMTDVQLIAILEA